MADLIRQDDDNDLQPQHEKSEIPPDPPSPVSQPSRSRPSRKIVYILLLGPSGVGKSLLSNTVCDEQVPVATPGSGLCTTSVRSQSFVQAEQEFRLIDTPGFNNSPTNNRDVLCRLARYLMTIYNTRKRKISGVVYMHPEGSNLDCSHLRQNMVALKSLIGPRCLPHLKIGIVPNDNRTVVGADTIRSLQDPASPFHAVHAEGAEILGLPLQPETIREFLLGYAQLPSLLLRVQMKMAHNQIGPLEPYIEKLLDPNPEQSTPGRSPQSRRDVDRISSRSLETDLTEATERSRQLGLALVESEAEVKLLRDQLEQTRSEYASLRSELQLNDNTEQSKVVQSLQGLNRDIGNFGRSVAEHIVDNYVRPHTDGHTTLKASNLPRVKAQFYHQEGRPSLVLSSTGDGMLTEDFFDLGVRFILCKRLHEDIFLPFHPTLVGNPRNEFMNNLYQEIRCQDRQTVASKWRANSFLALSKNNDPEIRAEYVRKCMESIKMQDLGMLFANFFDENTRASLADSHDGELEKLVSLAWDWNHVLKGSVVMLGDFQPTAYESGVPFDPALMVEFEPDKRSKKVPNTALCTIGLGLTVSRSKDKGNALDDAVVCKASVVTEHVHE